MNLDARACGFVADRRVMSELTKDKKRRLTIILRVMASLFGVALAGFLVLTFLVLTGLHAPAMLRGSIEERLNASLGGERISIGDIRFQIDGLNKLPRITLEDIKVQGPEAQTRARIPEIRAEFRPIDLLVGRLNPVSVTLFRAELNMKRAANGNIDISIGESGSGSVLEQGGTIAGILSAFDTVLSTPLMSRLRDVRTINSHINLDDQLSGRTWQLTDAGLTLANSEKKKSGTLSFKLDSGGADTAHASVAWLRETGGDKYNFTTRFDGFQTVDIADQVVVFDWLRALDAPVSGSMSLDIFNDGSFGKMSAVLDIGAGSIRQTEQFRPITFRGAKAYVTYDRTAEKLVFDQITLDTGAMKIAAEGQSYLRVLSDPTVGTHIEQLKFPTVSIATETVFA